VNDPLRRALTEARLRETDVATALSVDPKTVQRWLAGRIPHPRHRWAVADLLRLDERELWPDQDGFGGPTCREIKASYPHRSAVPRETWRQLFANAEHDISILAYAALFLAEDVELVRILAGKARAGVSVRLLLADPDSPQVAERGTEEGIGAAVGARVHNAVTLFRPLLETEGVEARQHQTVLYNSIFRADDEMLINPQVHGIAAAYAPVLHLRHAEGGGMFITYIDSFERVWSGARSAGHAAASYR
jgi:transcriptional regulator with XRE-family HTH domain